MFGCFDATKSKQESSYECQYLKNINCYKISIGNFHGQNIEIFEITRLLSKMITAFQILSMLEIKSNYGMANFGPLN